VTVTADATGKRIFNVGSRGRVFSKLAARAQAMPISTPVTSYEVVKNPSKAFRLQPWYERVGEQRTITTYTDDERFYDSMVPNLPDCLKADGNAVAHTDFWLSPVTGTIAFNYNLPGVSTLLNNTAWTYAFPFEPRYLPAGRDPGTSRAIFSTAFWHATTDQSTDVTAPVLIRYLIPFFGGMQLQLAGGTLTTQGWADVNLTNGLTASMTSTDMSKVMYGYGDTNSIGVSNGVRSGANNMATFRDSDLFGGSSYYVYGPIIRGWKYGLSSGIPMNSGITWRRDRFGQFRDMLEQRPDTRFYKTSTDTNGGAGIKDAAVYVTFVDSSGKITAPENTWAQNLSNMATSSYPYFDGETRNRSPINKSRLNQIVLNVGSDTNGNITL
jgi:hypothetical protein